MCGLNLPGIRGLVDIILLNNKQWQLLPWSSFTPEQQLPVNELITSILDSFQTTLQDALWMMLVTNYLQDVMLMTESSAQVSTLNLVVHVSFMIISVPDMLLTSRSQLWYTLRSVVRPDSHQTEKRRTAIVSACALVQTPGAH
jgi:hypothetical protein